MKHFSIEGLVSGRESADENLKHFIECMLCRKRLDAALLELSRARSLFSLREENLRRLRSEVETMTDETEPRLPISNSGVRRRLVLHKNPLWASSSSR